MGRCSKCGLPRRGHKGPLGEKCQMQRDLDSFAEPKKIIDESAGNAIRQLSKEMSDLAVSVQALTAEHYKMKEELLKVGQHNTEQEFHSISNRHLDPRMQHGVGLTGQQSCRPSDNADNPVGSQGASIHAGAVKQREPDIGLITGARVSKKIADAALLGEFVSLSDFIPSLEPSKSLTTTIMNNELLFSEKKTRRNVDSFLTWSKAWAGYEALIVGKFPEHYLKFTQYRLFMQELDAKFSWNAVYVYDRRLRHVRLLSCSWDFHITETELYVNLLEYSKNNTSGCFRCKSLAHHISDCPFSEGPEDSQRRAVRPFRPTRPYNAGRKQHADGRSQLNPNAPPFNGNRNSAPQFNASTRYVCNNFNAGRCFNSGCPRKHECAQCGGREPIYKCPSCVAPSLNSGNTSK